jgi:hypothetical protein
MVYNDLTIYDGDIPAHVQWIDIKQDHVFFAICTGSVFMLPLSTIIPSWKLILDTLKDKNWLYDRVYFSLNFYVDELKYKFYPMVLS